MRVLLASVAGLALAATPALAQPGKGNGNGNGQAKERGAQMQRGNGIGNGGGQGNGNAGRGNDRGPQVQRGQAPERARSRGNDGNGSARNVATVRGDGAGSNTARQVERRIERQVERRVAAPIQRPRDEFRDAARRADDDRDYYAGNRDDRRWERAGNTRILRQAGEAFGFRQARDNYAIDGCPPGLAKKRNGCNPPGQLRQRYREFRPDYFGYGSYGNDRYYYDDGYLVRFGRGDGISAYIPLLGGALNIGNAWPDYYESRRVPAYYENYYSLGGPQRYRYANDVIYRVDPETAAITSIAALLTGDDFTIGRPLPAGYDVYNVPLPYRDRYRDGPDAYYRYSDGYVYQVDPETRLIAAAIELLV